MNRRGLVAVFLLFSFNANLPVSAAPWDNAIPVPGTQVWLGQQRLHIHCMGRGAPTVLFDSGLGGTSLDWVRVQPRVAEFTRACSYDRAGYGWSDKFPGPRTSDRIVSELEHLLGYGSVRSPYVLVGHSFGGLNMRLFAQRNPERTVGLVLIDATHEDQFDRFDAEHIQTPVPTGRQFVIGNHFLIPDGLPAEVRDIAQRLALTNDAQVSLRSELRYLRASAEQLQANRTLPDVPLVVIAHSIDAGPTKNRRKAELWMELQLELSIRTPRGTLVIADTGDHHVQLEEPETVVDAIRAVVQASRLDMACGSAGC